MTEIKGIDTDSTDPARIWVNCRGQRIEILFRYVERIGVIKMQYDIAPKEEPYVDASSTDFHHVLDHLRKEMKAITGKMIENRYPENRHVMKDLYNYLGVDTDAHCQKRQEERENGQKKKKTSRSRVCKFVEMCRRKDCKFAHKADEFTPEECFMKDKCNKRCLGCREGRDCILCYCNCKYLHPGQTIDSVF